MYSRVNGRSLGLNRLPIKLGERSPDRSHVAVGIGAATCLSLLIMGLSAFAQVSRQTAAIPDGNLDRCLKGLPTCRISQLTPAEIARIGESGRERNLENCR